MPYIQFNRYGKDILGGGFVKKNEGTYMDPAIKVDPNGSYTGRPKDKREKPIQDADDL